MTSRNLAVMPALQVSQLTAPGRGAVATLQLRGEGIAERIAGCCRLASGRRLAERPLRAILFARWGHEPAEEVVISRLTETLVELHCHGGSAAVERILAHLATLGFVQTPWDQAVASADPLTDDARAALAEATTERTAAILLDQYHGALRRALEELLADLRSGDTTTARWRLSGLLSRASLGQRLTRPWRVVMSGPPNVGKSSLVNALLGFSRAIVAPTPGTTRDVVSATTALLGWPVELSDTAGRRRAEDPLEQAGIARALAAADAADLVLEVFDAREPAVSPLFATSGRRLRVGNKIDLLPAGSPVPEGLLVSARTGAGLADLQAAIVQALVPNPPSVGAAVPFRAEHVAALATAAAQVDRNKAALAVATLESLLSGRTTPETDEAAG